MLKGELGISCGTEIGAGGVTCATTVLSVSESSGTVGGAGRKKLVIMLKMPPELLAGAGISSVVGGITS